MPFCLYLLPQSFAGYLVNHYAFGSCLGDELTHEFPAHVADNHFWVPERSCPCAPVRGPDFIWILSRQHLAHLVIRAPVHHVQDRLVFPPPGPGI